MQKEILASLRKAGGGAKRSPFAWWIWAVIAQIAYLGLYVAEDRLRLTSDLGADALDGVKLLLLCAWAAMAWRSAKNAETMAWTIAARAILMLTVGVTAVTL